MLPRPTADPTAAKINPILEPQLPLFVSVVPGVPVVSVIGVPPLGNSIFRILPLYKNYFLS
jgi:hypothetical protein